VYYAFSTYSHTIFWYKLSTREGIDSIWQMRIYWKHTELRFFSQRAGVKKILQFWLRFAILINIAPIENNPRKKEGFGVFCVFIYLRRYINFLLAAGIYLYIPITLLIIIVL